MNEFIAVVTSLAVRAPVLIALIVAAVLALINWGQLGRAAGLALAGALTLIVAELVFGALSTLAPMLLVERGYRAAEMGTLMAVVAMVSSLVHAAGFGLLIGAIFTGRAAQPPAGSNSASAAM